ncbi:bifunctional (p)ppGpp synthetase/guanosine-3',5'-bis(diphosphate) 3'-pyrophosphohydrolase [Runella rosea]|uniref:Bifunctional (P)ppGpp synthetase/guanosine-3',5'-bis(Diphosphate) 3'-pyrophosphohydrolase n=1 Tax=Runella rosea TaxID=2259595 RepID=A0A344TQV5_9BACT|nr:HD domain-containing protein [Runella rosea]AXE21026.1 bifunctional (p)ppGpp synthetase/guanosine-3',5'-bis(diphosphate) 3'-pyrophosphohydrolase [Runella rosea]
MQTQSYYQKAIKFATLKHLEQNQTVPGTPLPYVVHLSNVAMEILIAAQNSPNFDVDFAIQVALLHDTLEDTTTTLEELSAEFGARIAEAVLALTKNNELPKSEKMTDSLNRIKKLQKETWAVKLADRITNMQMPPSHWSNAKKIDYQKEAIIILEALNGGNIFLENRLRLKIAEYDNYLQR